MERGQLVGGEEFRALEAALAFFDDGCSDENFSSDHSSDDSASSVHGGVCNSVFKQKSQDVSSSDSDEIERIKAKLVISGRNRSRDLQKLELLQLRVEAAALQENLKKLRQASLTRRCDTVALDAWKGLAKKQKRLRRDAEITNKELRVVYAKQIETMKAIKRIFRKPAEAKRSACILRNFFVNAYYDVEKDAMVVIERLSSTLNKVFADTDQVFLSNGLLGISSTYSNTYTQPLSATSTHIEVLKCGVLPFDFRVVADAFYGKLTAGCGFIKVENVNTNKAKVQNVIARAFTVEVEERVKTQPNELMEAFGVVLDGVSFYETARCVMSELAPGLCLLQLCIGLTVEATHIALCREFTERLHEMLAHLKREVFDVAQRDVEHELLVQKNQQ